MVRLVCSALVAGALLLPVTMSNHVSGQALAQATDPAAEKAPAKTTKKKRAAAQTKAGTTKKKRELTEGQKAARERQKQCGEEWREAKKGGKVEKGMTWPKYWSACNTRLKGKSA
jgi:hypothetical protein